MSDIQITYPPELIVLGRKVRTRISAVVQAGAQNIKAYISKYPPATMANAQQPYPGRWYQRGFGPRWSLVGGGVSGRKTSETLNRRWSVKKTQAGFGAIIGNNASYAKYVHSDEDQARFHSLRGWITDKQAIEHEQDDVIEMLERAIQQELESVG
jgi:hypothetical protein